MAATGTTASELLIDIDNIIGSKTQPNTITPTTHSDLLNNMVSVLSTTPSVGSGTSVTNLGIDINGMISSGSTVETVGGKQVYTYYNEGTGFTNPSNYALIPTGLDLSLISIIEVHGWCDYATSQTASLYASYFDANGDFRAFWTGALNRPWRLTIRYILK